jgi:Zn-finger nucleic acid-binding protein
MDFDDLNIVQLELKYCERCGGLWVREMGIDEIYCATCAIAMIDCATATRRHSSPRLPINHKSREVSGPKVVAICAKGGKA